MQPYLIGIAGPSCSGKSEVSRRLARILRAPIVPIDHYYRDLSHIPLEERAKINFDSPDSLDRELISQHVQALRRGQGIDHPTYDFARHTRASATEHISASGYVIVEGLFALSWPEIRERLDFRIYISADHHTCLTRRIFRDVRERGRTEDYVRAQYEATVRPMADLHVAPAVAWADLVLAGIAPVKQSVFTILLYIAQRIRDPAVREFIESYASHEAAD